MNKQALETAVGLFVVVGFAALFLMAMQVSNLSSYTNSDGSYEIKARFDNVGGLKVRSPVAAAGVRIGQVVNIEYDKQGYEALVTLSIEARYNNFPNDTAASILTSGLLGEQYVELEPGAADTFLEQGSEIDITQSALVLEQIVGQFLYSKANE